MISAFIFAFFLRRYMPLYQVLRGREVALGPFLCVSIAAVYVYWYAINGTILKEVLNDVRV